MWQDNTQVNYFGIGPDVGDDDRSQYRLQAHDVVGYAKATTSDWLSITGKLGWLGHPKLMDPGGTFVRDLPSTKEAFPADPPRAWRCSRRSCTPRRRLPRTRVIIVGTRRAAPSIAASLTNYWDRTYDAFTFHTWEAEGLQYVPLAGARVVLAFHWMDGGRAYLRLQRHPFYMLPAIGGSRTLRAYHDFEFHDNNLIVAGAESRFALWQHLDAALLLDAGNVASRYSDLNFDKTLMRGRPAPAQRLDDAGAARRRARRAGMAHDGQHERAVPAAARQADHRDGPVHAVGVTSHDSPEPHLARAPGVHDCRFDAAMRGRRATTPPSMRYR